MVVVVGVGVGVGVDENSGCGGDDTHDSDRVGRSVS
jgi:hypothetical protein